MFRSKLSAKTAVILIALSPIATARADDAGEKLAPVGEAIKNGAQDTGAAIQKGAGDAGDAIKKGAQDTGNSLDHATQDFRTGAANFFQNVKNFFTGK